ncbi:MAG TPA: NAD(P)H-dependent oxidoreductase [Holophagaceae bacterium]|nr:NAD(P)H-dependent oxidoreductase [Holophagaceae bacterium]
MTPTTLPTVAPETLLEALQWRYATKAFDPAKTIPVADWQALEASLVLTPSSYGLQPYKFLVITDPVLKAQLRPVSWGQSQITDASHLVVFLARNTMTEAYVDGYIDRVAEVRGVAVGDLAGYRNLMVDKLVKNEQDLIIPEWTARQAYLAFGQLMQTSALMGIDACPIEGLDPKAYDRILGLEGGDYRTVAVCALGYRAEGDKYAALPKVRQRAEVLIERR